MNRSRLEAFSDGVLAIIITIMVLELHVPEEPTWAGLAGVLPGFFSYLLSFVYVGIYWNNHHMLHLVSKVNGMVLWANLHLLFWLSLFPFTTRWMDESGYRQVPVLIYGTNLLLAAIAYFVLESTLIRQQGRDGRLARATGRDWKGKASPVIYIAGIALTFVHPLLGVGAFAVVAAVWLVPDRRVERFLAAEADQQH
ncbi:putative integral membrane protein [Arthrobacter crystallopoietes BAB-32]|uniref:Putative integral membrane protein n=1 Tax=Arthrobacter crystallopoietes BAB-32 TaxID=1246476 RepID=N1V1S6_9MICC|nr:TMEM175 family protein [Arthrobacter crystallopoietes]EMY34032.1 putative integral membrane protein [Arthrobacter crystallopoietes BAB-32]